MGSCSPSMQHSAHIDVNYFGECDIFFPIGSRALGLLSSFSVIFRFFLFPKNCHESWKRLSGEALGPVSLLSRVGDSLTSEYNAWELIDNSLPTAERDHWCYSHYLSQRDGWTEEDRGLYISAMHSFISGHNSSIFIWSKLSVTHQGLSSLTASPYLKFPFVFFPF